MYKMKLNALLCLAEMYSLIVVFTFDYSFAFCKINTVSVLYGALRGKVKRINEKKRDRERERESEFE